MRLGNEGHVCRQGRESGDDEHGQDFIRNPGRVVLRAGRSLPVVVLRGCRGHLHLPSLSSLREG
jgi:hypothetical protein